MPNTPCPQSLSALVRATCLGLALSACLTACVSDTAPTASHTLTAQTPASGGAHSNLWGVAGERFDEAGPLTDWSYAGYRAGEVALPRKAPTLDVTRFGAVPDDGKDDSVALLAALKAAKKGDVVHLPAGRYVLRQILDVPGGVVLQGAGSARTIIDIPIHLKDLNPATNPSFSGGFIRAVGSTNDGARLTTITAEARRGDRYLALASTAGLAVGQWVQVEQTDRDGDLLRDVLYLQHSTGLGNYDNLRNARMMEFFSRIREIHPGGITLERALPLSVKPQYRAELHSVAFPLEEVGIEGLTIRFPKTTYPGHFREFGYNAIDMVAAHSWVRDVHMINVDYGVNLRNAHFVTVEDVVVMNEDHRSGHHALNISYGSDNLLRRFDIQTPLLHDITVEWYTFGNVITQGKGANLSMDHHKGAPYANLFSDLHLGRGTQPWLSGGRNDRGYNTAAYATFWNLKADRKLAEPPWGYGPHMVFVGYASGDNFRSALHWWHEDLAPASLSPQNIWLAQRARRLGGVQE